MASQAHRGPDATGIHVASNDLAGLGHNRLSILDLSPAGRQPMSDVTGRYWIVFNGEIYNYVELRSELESSFSFHSRTDTEVLLAAYQKWGMNCLDRLIGMFAFVIWDTQEESAFGARDRFGVKPLHIHLTAGGGLWLTSEIKAFHAAGLAAEPDPVTWATYLSSGAYDHGDRTFWREVRRLSPGACFTWSVRKGFVERTWYDPAASAIAQGPDKREETVVAEELLGLLDESVRLRFRSDVPVGICLSGGLDSSLLLGLVHRLQGRESNIKTFTFYCGDPAYDELPWVEQMLKGSHHPACFCRLAAEEVPELARQVQQFQDEPFGGIPTLGMAKVHQRAKAEGVVVLLDGNGVDEGWAGYDYYQKSSNLNPALGPVQGSVSRSTRPECLDNTFARLSAKVVAPAPFGDQLLDLQYRDVRLTKIPRAMRFADRVSMMVARELREPFLDHRILELGLRQAMDRKIRDGQGKWLVRKVSRSWLPEEVREAPKRPVQTPQREWLRGPLASWAAECIEDGLAGFGADWLNPGAVRREWQAYLDEGSDNSFYIWQWITIGLMSRNLAGKSSNAPGLSLSIP